MFRRLFQFSSNGNNSQLEEEYRNGSGNQSLSVAELADAVDRASAGHVLQEAASLKADARADNFEFVYQNAAVKPPRIAYGILKASEMLNSPHLSGMSPDARRCALLMALEAGGAEIEDLLQDAVVRQRALNDFEDAQQQRLKEFETAKSEENRQIQTELERITSQYLSRIQANVNQIASEQDNFHAWQKRKQQESQRITEAATFCVPQGTSGNNSSLTAVLERATTGRR